MKLFRTIVVLVLLVVWLPATSFCLLERAGWLADDDCCASSSPQSPAGEPAGDNPCCTLASACYKTEDFRTLTPVVPTLFLLASSALPEPAPVVDAARPHFHPSAPPDRRNRWHFSSRAALPSRAPSPAV